MFGLLASWVANSRNFSQGYVWLCVMYKNTHIKTKSFLRKVSSVSGHICHIHNIASRQLFWSYKNSLFYLNGRIPKSLKLLAKINIQRHISDNQISMVVKIDKIEFLNLLYISSKWLTHTIKSFYWKAGRSLLDWPNQALQFPHSVTALVYL